MSTVTIDQVKSNLLTVEQIQNQLAATEPLSTTHISSESKILFHLDPDWATDLDATPGSAPVGAVMRIDGTDHPLTKEAALQAAANFGLSGAYVKKTPAHLIESHLNYWYSGGFGSNEYNALSVGDNIAAFTRPTLVPFSNLQLMESAINGIKDTYGSDAEIYGDYKFHNSLQSTNIRLIVPEASRTMHDTNMKDVPTGADDRWSAGLHLHNSAIGKGQTTLEAYLFRWWCTNGATTQLEDAGVWSRRLNGQEVGDVYEWAQTAVDEVLGGLEARFDQIQALTQLNVAGNTGDIVREIFSTYNVPVSQRESITSSLLESENLTMYSIMNAITSTANSENMDDARSDRLMRIGGAIPTTTFDTLKAKVWREGHLADPTAPNPYEIALVNA